MALGHWGPGAPLPTMSGHEVARQRGHDAHAAAKAKVAGFYMLWTPGISRECVRQTSAGYELFMQWLERQTPETFAAMG